MKTRVLMVGFVALFVATGLSGCASSTKSAKTASGPGNTSAPGVTVQAGINDPKDPTIAVLEFTPAAVTVGVGQPITWSWAGASEPHSVTFFPTGQNPPSPDKVEPLFAPTPASGPYDGSALVNSGLLPLGPAPVKPMTMTFSKPGSYTYYCVIHPQMVGTVTVASSRGDTANAVKARGAEELTKWLAEGRAAKTALLATPSTKTPNTDGTTTWGVQMGVATPHTELLAFGPLGAVKAGDTVRFVNESSAPHTATFFNDTPPIQSPFDPKAVAPSPGPSPQSLAATGLINTGLLPPNAPPGHGPPEAVRSYSLIAKTPGTYKYVCIFHLSSAMVGAVDVA